MIEKCPTCGTKLAKDDFMSFAFILGGEICRHCLDEPSGQKTKHDHMVGIYQRA